MKKYTIKVKSCQDLSLESSSEITLPLYYRRPDISLAQRTQMALSLLSREGEYGVVTPLAATYDVSRTFLYNLRETARGALEMALAGGVPGRPTLSSTIEVDKNRIERGIVTLATVGCCSIEQTQRVVQELLDVSPSVGYISGVLQTAEACAQKANANFIPRVGITLAADEIFDGESPHLVLVDPQSLLIVELSRQDHRDSLTWGLTFLECAQQGLKIERVVSDGAQGLKKGIVEAELGIEHQLDLFHTIREALRVQKQLEREAYKAIDKEAKRFGVIASAKSERVFCKRYEQWEKAAFEMEKQIKVYETYSWLVVELRQGLEVVDTQSGGLRKAEEMETLIGVIASLMEEIPHPKVQAVAERFLRQKGELVKYLTPLHEKLAELIEQVGDPELVRLCLLEWQLEKGATPNSLETCRLRLGEWKAEVVKQIRQTVRWLLGNAVRASSLVETVNSWLRPFLWRRKGNGRGIYNLLRCCWNTHRFRRGKRRGKTPFQLAGIEVSAEDWLELLGFAPKSVKSVN